MSVATIGVVVVLFALAAISFLVWWSFRIIRRIHERQLGSAREIMRELGNGL